MLELRTWKGGRSQASKQTNDATDSAINEARSATLTSSLLVHCKNKDDGNDDDDNNDGYNGDDDESVDDDDDDDDEDRAIVMST